VVGNKVGITEGLNEGLFEGNFVGWSDVGEREGKVVG
jgi:hypothetical protein